MTLLTNHVLERLLSTWTHLIKRTSVYQQLPTYRNVYVKVSFFFMKHDFNKFRFFGFFSLHFVPDQVTQSQFEFRHILKPRVQQIYLFTL